MIEIHFISFRVTAVTMGQLMDIGLETSADFLPVDTTHGPGGMWRPCRFPVSGGTPGVLCFGQRWMRNESDTAMREIVFRLLVERPGLLEAQADDFPVRIAAPTLEELQHEAREALIDHLGQAHCAYRARVRRCPSSVVSAIRPLRRQAKPCC